MKLYVYTDGAARGNPGKSASGWFIYDEHRKLVIKGAVYNNVATNNVAEYLAVINALKKIHEAFGGKNSIELYSDSKLMVNQLNGVYKVKNPELKKLNEEALNLAARFEHCGFINVPREEEHITMVDRSINKFLDDLDSIKYNNRHRVNGKQERL